MNKLEKLLFIIGRCFLRAGYRVRAYNTKMSYCRVGRKNQWTVEKEQRYRLAIKEIRKWRDRDLLAGVGSV